jgi:hypothetical protein
LLSEYVSKKIYIELFCYVIVLSLDKYISKNILNFISLIYKKECRINKIVMLISPMITFNSYLILVGILGFTAIIFFDNSYSVEISNDQIDSISDLAINLPSGLNTNTLLTSSATLDFGSLKVATEVKDNTDINDQINFDEKLIKVRIEETTAIPQEFKAENGQVKSVLVTPGDYKVTPFLVIDESLRDVFGSLITRNLLVEILIPISVLIDEDSDINDGDGDENLLEFIGDCDSSITKDQEKFCAIKIVLDQEDIDDIIRFLNGEGLDGDGLESDIVFDDGVDTDIDTNDQLESDFGVATPTITEGVLPIDVCKTDTSDFQPISAVYNFDGVLKLAQMKNIGKSSNSEVNPGFPDDELQQFVFSILFDNKVSINPTVDNTVRLAPTNPYFKAKVSGDREPFDHDSAGFSISRIWTDCKFTAIAKAITKFEDSSQISADGDKLIPLGTLNEIYPDKASVPSSLDELEDPGSLKLGVKEGLSSGVSKEKLLITSPGTGGVRQFMLNPPFLTCQDKINTGSGSVAVKDNLLSHYTIVGAAKTNELKGGSEVKASLRVTVDINPNDQAVITENNNEIVKLNLVINPGERNVEVVPMSLLDISTDCLSVSFAEQLVQDF